jgi:hypothetical protein
MTAAKVIKVVAIVVVVAALSISVHRSLEARSAATELASARQERRTMENQISSVENKLRTAERFANEAEQDRRDLLKALNSIRAEQATAARPPPPPPIASLSGPEPYKTPAGEILPPEQQIKLAQERAYAQAVARRRKEEATQQANFEELLRPLRDDPAAKYNRRIETAGFYAVQAEFQTAINVYNQAMAEKPPDLPLSDAVKTLQATLQAQNARVDVTLVSDGQTFVSVLGQRAGQRAPEKFGQAVVGILPGNYEVIGRRPGYRDVVVPLEVRNGAPPPVLSVVCTQPVEK